MTANVENMMYQGEVPWHGLGTRVENAVTAEEAIKAAGLDWEVEAKPVYTTVGGEFQEIAYNAICRGMDGQVYTVASKKYTPVQNREAFAFFDGVVGTGEAKYHTAGSLGKGERIWILAKLPESFSVYGDEVEKYILLVNSHNKTEALQMLWTPIRVVCQNTLQMALGRKLNVFYARHMPGWNREGKVKDAQQILGFCRAYYDEFKERAERLAVLQLPAPDLEKYVNFSITGKEEVEIEKVYKPTMDAIYKIKELVEVGRGQDNPKIRGTAWGVYNAVVEYVDHYSTPRKVSRLASAWFGSGANIKQRAWDYWK